VLFAFFPDSFKSFAIWIVKNTNSKALVVFEVSLVNLAVWPVVGAFAMLHV